MAAAPRTANRRPPRGQVHAYGKAVLLPPLAGDFPGAASTAVECRWCSPAPAGDDPGGKGGDTLTDLEHCPPSDRGPGSRTGCPGSPGRVPGAQCAHTGRRPLPRSPPRTIASEAASADRLPALNCTDPRKKILENCCMAPPTQSGQPAYLDEAPQDQSDVLLRRQDYSAVDVDTDLNARGLVIGSNGSGLAYFFGSGGRSTGRGRRRWPTAVSGAAGAIPDTVRRRRRAGTLQLQGSWWSPACRRLVLNHAVQLPGDSRCSRMFFSGKVGAPWPGGSFSSYSCTVSAAFGMLPWIDAGGCRPLLQERGKRGWRIRSPH